MKMQMYCSDQILDLAADIRAKVWRGGCAVRFTEFRETRVKVIIDVNGEMVGWIGSGRGLPAKVSTTVKALKGPWPSLLKSLR